MQGKRLCPTHNLPFMRGKFQHVCGKCLEEIMERIRTDLEGLKKELDAR